MDSTVPEPAKWGLDPTFWSCMKLANVQILSLLEHQEHSECFLLGNRVVSKVQILGDVVSVHERERNVHFSVDDGSAVVACVLWKDRDEPDWSADANGLTLGSVVHVTGKLKVFREERQVSVLSWCPVSDVHAQCVHWLEVVQLNRDVYAEPAAYRSVENATAAAQASAATVAGGGAHTGKMASGMAGILQRYFGERGAEDAESSFVFEEIQEVARLRAEACRMLGFSAALSPEQCTRLKRFFASSIRQLVCRGVLYQTDIVTDQYAVVSVQTHIVPAVRALLRNACAHGYRHMSERQVADGVREQSDWHYVTSEQIREALRLCLHDGFIYEVDGGFYRPV